VGVPVLYTCRVCKDLRWRILRESYFLEIR
jgi:hypothetical protein